MIPQISREIVGEISLFIWSIISKRRLGMSRVCFKLLKDLLQVDCQNVPLLQVVFTSSKRLDFNMTYLLQFDVLYCVQTSLHYLTFIRRKI